MVNTLSLVFIPVSVIAAGNYTDGVTNGKNIWIVFTVMCIALLIPVSFASDTRIAFQGTDIKMLYTGHAFDANIINKDRMLETSDRICIITD